MKSRYFLTGTDTEIGKTFITCALLHCGQQRGLKVAGIKPIAAGTDALGNNEDVEQIRAASNVLLPNSIINPYCFNAAVAPHIAAAEAGVRIDFARIKAACEAAQAQTDLLIVEGVGGFRVPLGGIPERPRQSAGGSSRENTNKRPPACAQAGAQDSADLAVALALPVILVVGLRLGCISHALLTAEAITGRGLLIAGWIGNLIDPNMARLDENLATLEGLINAPRWGVVPHLAAAERGAAASFLRLPGDFGL
jgi:dethiobiotin synthetase